MISKPVGEGDWGNAVRSEQTPVRTETLSMCPDCAGRALKLWRTGKDFLLGVSEQRFPYLRCRDCGLIFLSVRPTVEAIRVFYPESYHPYSEPAQLTETGSRAGSGVERFLQRIDTGWLKRFRCYILETAQKHLPDDVVPAMQTFYRPPRQGATLLDFGCGSPWFLSRRRKQKWTTIGMDFLESVVDQVNQEGHRGLLVSEAGWAEIDDASLDAARMNHVLEHLHEPKPILARLMAKLKPGGIIHVAVPNPLGLSARAFRSRWFGLEAPRHLRLYSPAGIASLLTDFGFVEVQILHERTPKDFSRSLGYLLHDLRLMQRRSVMSIGDDPILNAWFAPLLWVAGGLGYGDRIHAFAKKPANSNSVEDETNTADLSALKRS